jgi:hypothetical protein
MPFEFSSDAHRITNDSAQWLQRPDTPGQDFVRSAIHAGVQTPLNGVVQIVDKATGTDWLPKVQFIDPPEKVEFFSSRSHAQQFGAMVGTAINLLILQRAVGWTGNSLFGQIENTAANHSRLALRSIGEAAASGFIHNAVFRPSSDHDFLGERMRNGLVGAGCWATVGASSFGLKHFGKTHDNILGSILRNDVSSTIVSGIPGGIVCSQLRSLADGKGFANTRTMAEAVYSQSILGGIWAGGKHAFGATHADTQLRDRMHQDSLVARGKIAPPTLPHLTIGIPTFNTLPYTPGTVRAVP